MTRDIRLIEHPVTYYIRYNNIYVEYYYLDNIDERKKNPNKNSYLKTK